LACDARHAPRGPAGRDGRGRLFHMLRNRTYCGEVAHKGNVYPGEYAAIVDAALWDAVAGAAKPDHGEKGGLVSWI
jgi:hypothetical protein